MFLPWMNYSYQAAMLSWDAQRVIGLRLAKVAAGGPAASSEMSLMISEKVSAAAQAGLTLALGGSHEKVLSGYRRAVRANLRRLGR
jgi:hypothetical protein